MRSFDTLFPSDLTDRPTDLPAGRDPVRRGRLQIISGAAAAAVPAAAPDRRRVFSWSWWYVEVGRRVRHRLSPVVLGVLGRCREELFSLVLLALPSEIHRRSGPSGGLTLNDLHHLARFLGEFSSLLCCSERKRP